MPDENFIKLPFTHRQENFKEETFFKLKKDKQNNLYQKKERERNEKWRW